MNIEKLKKYTGDSRLCSSTEKCAVACTTADLGRASFRRSL